MKVRLEIDSQLAEEEIVIRSRKMDDRVEMLLRLIGGKDNTPVFSFFREDKEYFFPVNDILFFETEGEKAYAHTARDAFAVRYRLYELENMLPEYFVRVSKGGIVNVNKVYSVQRSISSASLVHFFDTHKQIYVSRLYYKEFIKRLNEERGNI